MTASLNSTKAPTAPYVASLTCLRCGAVYPAATAPRYVCNCRPNVGSDLGTLDVQYDYDAIRQAVTPAQLVADPERSLGRYWPLLPIADRRLLPSLAVGNTPLVQCERLGAALGLRRLFVKDDGRNPSSSLKDRASAIAVARTRQLGIPVVATASTGNAAAALASQCAAVGQPNVIFVPKTAPQAKLAQLLVYGSRVLAIDGSYDRAFDLCIEACHTFGWYNRNTGYNPYMTEGKKTAALEMAEQLGILDFGGSPAGAILDSSSTADEQSKIQSLPCKDPNSKLFKAPDAVFVSVGDGCIIGGVHKGFKDLLALGWIDKMPRLYGVQSTQSAALVDAWRRDLDVPEPVNATTRADSISVNAPRDPVKALNAVRRSNGAFLAVSDEAILQAILPLARLGAIFAEPAGATAYAGLVAAVQQKLVQPDETIVVLNTGSGLKDVPAAISVTGGVTVIPPTLDAVFAATKDV
ncbi:MAG: pyridoxal-phosphate dependent enzyme [Caldilinea sp. CFX5]|nr:pyridoxal-phosphate dependent enzyme [Caldilinea sp. CFX5]